MFEQYAGTPQRIKVALPTGEVVTGTVRRDKTSGGLVLRRRLNSRRPDDLLTQDVQLLAVLRGENYIEIDSEGAKA